MSREERNTNQEEVKVAEATGNGPVDFSDPASLEAELKANEVKGTVVPGAKKEKKPAKPKIVTCPHCQAEFELPKSLVQRGVVAGIALEEMNEDQLKIEYRNANSVFYKQQKAKGKASDVATARLEAVKAAMAAKGIAPTARAAAVVDAASIAELIKTGKVTVEDIQKLLEV